MNLNENFRETFETRVLPRIIEIDRVDYQWRTRYNYDLYQLFDDPEASKLTKLQKLQWADYVPPKRVLEEKLKGAINEPREVI